MKKLVLLFIALVISNASCTTQSNQCPEHFADAKAPEFTNQKLLAKTKMLCFDGFAVMYSGVSRTPLWSAEHLTANRVIESKSMKRQNTFHAEDQLPVADRAELRDYAHSGFDRGHMSPSGDMPTANAQYQSFSLANIIPQDPNNNQNLWAGIEESIRKLARLNGDLYVITGPIFESGSIQRINGRVLVPTHIFKVIYDPADHEAAAYIAPNMRGSEYETVSIAELEKRTGINFFPRMEARAKQTKMTLPEPIPHGRKLRNSGDTDAVS
jgi:endonuclease G